MQFEFQIIFIILLYQFLTAKYPWLVCYNGISAGGAMQEANCGSDEINDCLAMKCVFRNQFWII